MSKPKMHTREDTLAFTPRPTPLNPVPPVSKDQLPLRSLETARLDSAVALVMLAEAHASVNNYDKAGVYIRAAFAQYAEATAAADSDANIRSDSLYQRIVLTYRDILNKQPVLPPETPIDVLLEMETESMAIAPAIRAKIDSLLLLTPREEQHFNRLFQELLADKSRTTSSKPQLPPVPVVTNQRVERALSFFLTRGRPVFQRWLDRSGRMIPVILPVLREEGIPEELFCLAMIESGLNPNAISKAKAMGVYQFIRATGRRYGLESTPWFDQRRNPTLATHAACSYLRELYNEFGDWYLAMASYNGGEGRVRRQIKTAHTKDYWKMSRLPRETKNYVPNYLAALILFQDPERWGFKRPQIEILPPSDSVLIDSPADLAELARLLGISEQELRSRNPELLSFCTDPNQPRYPLRVPRGMGLLLEDSLRSPNKPPTIQWASHLVRKGESLRSISRKYNIPEQALSSIPDNQSVIRGKSVSVGKWLKIPQPVANGLKGDAPPTEKVATTKASADSSKSEPTANQVEAPPRTSELVQEGDTLIRIAKRSGITLSELLEWNGLTVNSTIHPGNRLWTSPHQSASATAAERQ